MRSRRQSWRTASANIGLEPGGTCWNESQSNRPIARSLMSQPTRVTSRSPFSRSARRSAAVPGAPQAVTRTRSGRIPAESTRTGQARLGIFPARQRPLIDWVGGTLASEVCGEPVGSDPGARQRRDARNGHGRVIGDAGKGFVQHDIDRASAWHGASDRMPATGSSLYLEERRRRNRPDIGPIVVSNDRRRSAHLQCVDSEPDFAASGLRADRVHQQRSQRGDRRSVRRQRLPPGRAADVCCADSLDRDRIRLRPTQAL